MNYLKKYLRSAPTLKTYLSTIYKQIQARQYALFHEQIVPDVTAQIE